MKPELSHCSRRKFLATTGAFVATALTPALLSPSLRAAPAPQPARKLIGIQVGPASFQDEGTERVLDILQERGAVNALFVEIFAHPSRSTARPATARVVPDHGKPGYDATYRGGTFLAPHREFYTGTTVAAEAALAYPGYDVVADVLPAARRRGMKFYASYGDAFYKDIPGREDLREVDWQGRRVRTFCALHPDYRAYLTALAVDCGKSYGVDGVMWTCEQQGPLHSAIGASHGGGDSSRAACFCEFHQQAARARGIDVARAQAGFARLDTFVRAARAGQRPNDGYFVEFWRILLEYPELLAWEKLWTDGKYALYAEIRRAAKQGGGPGTQVGFHLWHANSFSPFFRAEQNYAELAGAADFLKVVAYDNAGGPRYVDYLNSIGATIFRDLPKDDLLRINNEWLNYSGEAPFDQLATAGLSANYVAAETKRAVSGAQGKCPVYTGIDIDIPTEEGQKRTTPAGVYATTSAALGAGADGLLFCRKYAEMRLDNLAAGGRAVREFRG